jgi:hypothetical protein
VPAPCGRRHSSMISCGLRPFQSSFERFAAANVEVIYLFLKTITYTVMQIIAG